MTETTVKCKKCNAVGWIEATPIGKRNFQKADCTNCGKRNYILTRKWGKVIQF